MVDVVTMTLSTLLHVNPATRRQWSACLQAAGQIPKRIAHTTVRPTLDQLLASLQSPLRTPEPLASTADDEVNAMPGGKQHPPAPVDPVSHEQWCAVDDYFSERLLGADPVLDQALKNSRDNRLDDHAVAPNQGKVLWMLAKMMRARNVLEVGTLGGYSTIWMARALPTDGKIVTLEHNPTYARVARENVEAAGFSDRVEVLEGDAVELLAQLEKDKRGPFDFIFIDANKQPEREYFEGCLKLSRPGTAIIGDNVVRDGEVANLDTTDERVKGVHRATEMLQSSPRFEACALQTVGVKGWDGWLLALVN